LKRITLPDVSIVCPTLNEKDNVQILYQHIASIVESKWELIFVDDHSQDGTRTEIEKLCRLDSRVRLISRVGRKGLASAAAEGFLSAIYDYCILIDADLQHDINNINLMLDEVIKTSADLVISSRFLVSQTLALSTQREKMSLLGNNLINFILRRNLTDPLSGCFLIKKNQYLKLHEELLLSGFKVLFDILSSPLGKKLIVTEVPIRFLKRHSGESKLRKTILIEFAWTYLVRTVERMLPIQFVKFSLIGVLGALLHYLILSNLLSWSVLSFTASQLVTTYIVMVNNFWLNNLYTFSSKRLFGGQFFFGLLKFIIFCSFGALVSLGFALYLKSIGIAPVFSGVLGTIAGSLWNYVLNYMYTWKETLD
jgi:dolichol-phosphate mannosyltransferase